MKVMLVCLAVMLFPALAVGSIVKKDLSDAVNDKSISLDAENQGGYKGKTTKLTIKNNTRSAIQIKVNLGVILIPAKPEYQPLVLAGEEMIVVAGSGTANIEVMTFCGNSPRWCPAAGLHYSFSHVASDTLVKILRFIKTYSLPEDLGQNAVWVITNYHDVGEAYDYRQDALSKKLMDLICSATGRPKPDYYTTLSENQTPGAPAYNPKVLKITAEFEVRLEAPKTMTLGVFNQQGAMIQKAFENQEFPAAGHRFGVEFEAADVPAGKYFIRLKEGETILQEKMVKVE